MQQTFFSIIIVSLNPGERLKRTLDSVRKQNFTDYEIIIKDGGSTDEALSKLQEEGYFADWPSVHIVVQKDSSIYDGMNQALKVANGLYVQFLNCGDCLYEPEVLQKVHDFIVETQQPDVHPHIFYGNQYNLIQQCSITSAPVIDDFTCYRNVPCHQVCFYDRTLFAKRAYLPVYTVRADYEHFLYAVYKEQAVAVAMPYIICFYEGGGYSETKENRKRSALQHREITKKYLGKKADRYWFIMLLSLAPLRTCLAESKYFSGFYNRLKSLFYRS